MNTLREKEGGNGMKSSGHKLQADKPPMYQTYAQQAHQI